VVVEDRLVVGDMEFVTSGATPEHVGLETVASLRMLVLGGVVGNKVLIVLGQKIRLESSDRRMIPPISSSISPPCPSKNSTVNSLRRRLCGSVAGKSTRRTQNVNSWKFWRELQDLLPSTLHLLICAKISRWLS